jgi:heme oxygenase
MIRCHLRPAFGGLLLREISVERTDASAAARGHLNPKTISNQLVLLGTMLNLAVDLGWLTAVPRIKKPIPFSFERGQTTRRASGRRACPRHLATRSELSGPQLPGDGDVCSTGVRVGAGTVDLQGINLADVVGTSSTSMHILPARPPDRSATALAALREATRERHASIEHALPLVEPGLRIGSYRRILQAFLGFYRPLEAGLAQLAQRVPGAISLEGRCKVPWLQDDLQALGVPESELASIPECPDVPVIDCAPRALGCMYVLEGATLGGQLISLRLEEHLGLAPGTGATFFAGYGGNTGARWRSFVATLDAESPPYQKAIAAAEETFDRFEAWLRTRGAPAWEA